MQLFPIRLASPTTQRRIVAKLHEKNRKHNFFTPQKELKLWTSRAVLPF